MPDLVKALCKFQADVGPIHKDAAGQHSKYATLQSVLATISPVLSKHGLVVTQTFDGGDLITTLHHISGETVTSTVPLIADGGRNPLHSWGGAVTYQRRYAILAILSLAAGIEDDDGQSATPAKMQKASTTSKDDFF